MEPQNLDVLNREAIMRWEQNAAFWDERFGDTGNDFHRTLVGQGLGIIGQPVPQYYFHRLLSALLAPALRAGFALDGLEEPVFDQPHQSSRPFSWSNYPEIPPVLAARVRLLLK